MLGDTTKSFSIPEAVHRRMSDNTIVAKIKKGETMGAGGGGEYYTDELKIEQHEPH